MSRSETLRIPVSGGDSVVLDWRAPEAGQPIAWFIHGFGSHRRGDKALYFGTRFAEIGWGWLAADLRGHGESDGDMRALTMTRMLDDARALARWRPAPGAPTLIIGSSMGAALAAWHLLDSPLAVRGLAMVGPSLNFPAGFAARLSEPERTAWRRDGVYRMHNEWLDLDVGYGLVEDAARYDPGRLIREHRTPSLIFHGMRDEAVDWRQSLAFVEDCASQDQRLVLVKNGDHRLTEHKAFLLDSMLSWWAGLA